jgi:hypothetical protein
MADKVNKSGGILGLTGALKVVLDTGGIPLALGDTFTLFGGTLAGSFSAISLPALPVGLEWNTSQLTGGGNGTLTVVLCTLGANASGATTICNGGSATLTATASGGSGIYNSYVWSPGGALGPSISVSPTTTTPYTVTVIDSHGCTATSSGVTVTVNNCTPPNATGIALDQNGNISLTVTGAVGTVWSLRTNNNVAAPLPWPNMTNGIIPSNPFTVLDVPPANSPHRYYYLTNAISP